MLPENLFEKGMEQLVVCCGDRELDEKSQKLRSKVYRDDLKHLSPEQWVHAVREARKRRWFPSVEELLDFAAEIAPKPESRSALGDEDANERARVDAMTPDEKRAHFAAGLGKIREELVKRGMPLGSIGRSMEPAK